MRPVNSIKIPGLIPTVTRVAIGCLIFCLATGAHATQETKEEAFFNRFVELEHNFDPAVADLYTDEARIRTLRLQPDGRRNPMEMSGRQMKGLIDKVMPLAEQRGDISTYSDVRYSTEGNRVTIHATRYSAAKCYTDPNYYIVIEDTGAGYRIVEEFAESKVASDCPPADSPALGEFLRLAKRNLDPQLPLMVDADTRLDEVVIQNDTFQYSYTLVNDRASELNLDAFIEAMDPLLIAQSCTVPSLRILVDQGATLSFFYRDSGGEPFIEMTVSGEQCR
ncbi:MAG: hypothetical protein KC897_02920 [Candidatus Omnitrophica bacterium]|nr:hypothetical protein [Candidatus Omnitrophota bacterium]MCB9721903.1 hypothetical protein [Candidatus Omnitrophota bacterium]